MRNSLLFLVVLLFLLSISCKKKSTNLAQVSYNIDTTTEKALVGTWCWDKQECYSSTNPAYLKQILYPNGDFDTYNPDGSLASHYTNSPYVLIYQLSDSVYTSGSSDAGMYGVTPYNCIIEVNGFPEHLDWYVVPNYGGSGKNCLMARSCFHTCGYIYTLTSDQLIIRTNTNTNMSDVAICYYHKVQSQ